MNVIPPDKSRSQCPNVPLLETGDRMKQKEFHSRYQMVGEDITFELVGGIVFMASPLRQPHALYEEELSYLLGTYRRGTPGVELLPNATTILGEESEPQPDLALRVGEEWGGQSKINKEEYLEGPPELVAEIAYSSRALDMHQKKEDYQKAGVCEYLVLCLEEQQIHWFQFSSKTEIQPNRQGIMKSKVFPGLWLDSKALLARDSSRLIEVVQKGLTSREHAAFVKRLDKARKKKK